MKGEQRAASTGDGNNDEGKGYVGERRKSTAPYIIKVLNPSIDSVFISVFSNPNGQIICEEAVVLWVK